MIDKCGPTQVDSYDDTGILQLETLDRKKIRNVAKCRKRFVIVSDYSVVFFINIGLFKPQGLYGYVITFRSIPVSYKTVYYNS